MENIIENAVECETLYGVVALAIVFAGLIVLAFIAYSALIFVAPLIYKGLCKICNTIIKYNKVHTKVGINKVSVESDLDR